MFMTLEQLKELTGAKSRKRVTHWLDDNGYKYQIGMDGWPRVLVAAVEKRLGATESAKPKPQEPDLSWT
jgi:hypothetical protein